MCPEATWETLSDIWVCSRLCPGSYLRYMALCPFVPGRHVGSRIRDMGLCPFVPSKLPQVHRFVPVCAPSPCRDGRGTKRNHLVGADVCAHLCLVRRGGYNIIRSVGATEAQAREPRVAPRVNGKPAGALQHCKPILPHVGLVSRFCPTSVLACACRPPLKLFRLRPHAGRGTRGAEAFLDGVGDAMVLKSPGRPSQARPPSLLSPARGQGSPGSS